MVSLDINKDRIVSILVSSHLQGDLFIKGSLVFFKMVIISKNHLCAVFKNVLHASFIGIHIKLVMLLFGINDTAHKQSLSVTPWLSFSIKIFVISIKLCMTIGQTA